jgi:hypothetical protein
VISLRRGWAGGGRESESRVAQQECRHRQRHRPSGFDSRRSRSGPGLPGRGPSPLARWLEPES